VVRSLRERCDPRGEAIGMFVSLRLTRSNRSRTTLKTRLEFTQCG
jgi:hypothetical protein